jgi:hypothetical protein
MSNHSRRLDKLEKRLLPAVETESSRRFRAGIEAGLQRALAHREASGFGEVLDVLPLEPADATRGMTEIQIISHNLHRGREGNHLRWAATKDAKALAVKDLLSPVSLLTGGR